MDVTLLIESLLGLIVILGVLMFFLLWSSKEKKRRLEALERSQQKEPEPEPKMDTSLEALRRVINNPNTSSAKLAEALELILKFHPTIHPKLGIRPHPDFDIYADILFHLGRHKHINKDILLHFDTELEKHNPSYKKELDDALMRGLNSRGI